jgi:branched-chain amino acid transport system permease protein
MITNLAIGIATGCVYALVALGYSLIYRTTGIVNFAQGAFVMVGGMSAYWLLHQFHAPYALAVLGGIAISVLVGLVLWGGLVLPLWRRNSASFTVILATLVFGDLVANVVAKTVSTDPQTLPGWASGFRVHLGSSTFDGQYLIVIVITVVSMAVVATVLRTSYVGKAMRACAADRRTSQLLGIAPARVGALAMAATAGLGGLGGAAFTPAQYTSYDAALTYGIYGFIAAVLGGFGNLWGALYGGILVGVVSALTARYISATYVEVIAFAILLALLTVRPQGILGSAWEGG